MSKFKDAVNVLGVRFQNEKGVYDQHSKVYYYANPFPDIKEGDYVIVNPFNKYNVVKVVYVGSTSDIEIHDVQREITGIADIGKFLAEQERTERKAELKKLMDEEIKKIQETVWYETFAYANPEMTKLYNEFKEL